MASPKFSVFWMCDLNSLLNYLVKKKLQHTSRLDPADDDVVDLIVSDLLVTTSKINNQIKLSLYSFLYQCILAAALTLRETVVRLSLSPSLPRMHTRTLNIHPMHICITYYVQIK
jgi:hypothetical protein